MVERDPDSLSPSNLGECFLLAPDSPELQAEAGEFWGCLGRVWRGMIKKLVEIKCSGKMPW